MSLRCLKVSLTVLALLHGVPAASQPAPMPISAPTLSGRTSKGEVVDLAALRGRVVMLVFWSTDCPVCLDTLPELRRNIAGWRGKDFTVLAVNQDRTARDLADYEKVLEQFGPADPQMKFVWRRDPQHRDAFGELPQREPHTVVIDRNGAVAKALRGRQPVDLWNDVAELLLN